MGTDAIKKKISQVFWFCFYITYPILNSTFICLTSFHIFYSKLYRIILTKTTKFLNGLKKPPVQQPDVAMENVLEVRMKQDDVIQPANQFSYCHVRAFPPLFSLSSVVFHFRENTKLELIIEDILFKTAFIQEVFLGLLFHLFLFCLDRI